MAQGERTVIVGIGAWGTTLAVMLAGERHEVVLWARTPEEADTLRAGRENKRFLPGVIFPDDLEITSSLEEALSSCKMLMLVVPAEQMRENVARIRPNLQTDTIVLSAAKGLETETALRMSEVIAQELPSEFEDSICVLSGPNLSREIIAGLPAGTVIASRNADVAESAQNMIMTRRFRVYTHDDVIGVELGGALKNIIALGAGAADQFGYGDNAKAIFMTRGLAEITRLGVAAGASPLTFAGLAGIGDLVCTCASRHSRNHYVGEELAKGRSLDAIQRSMNMVAEGVNTTKAALKLARRYEVEMPITEQIYQVLFEGKDPQQVIKDMMLRGPKREFEGPVEDWFDRLRV
ncbi:MAG: NAD(P)H-dependent glycerol-3-phosphate dehydrogenase [Anaerolineae bacterium]